VTTIYTIGFTQKSLRRFMELLQAAQVDAVIDTRLRPTSQLSGYAKAEDLAFVLETFGIAYEQQPDLAPTAEILDGYRKDHDWAGYVQRFTALIQEREIERIGQEIVRRHRAPCLLCSEAIAHQCHRRLVAEYWAQHLPGLEIVHL
jgi:uncharacterized protein (DUF488 family)